MEQNNQLVKENSAYYKQRQQLAEHPWGTLKRQRGFDYVLTRGKKSVLGEVSLVFIGYNLSRLENIPGGLESLKAFIGSVMSLLWRKRAYFNAIISKD